MIAGLRSVVLSDLSARASIAMQALAEHNSACNVLLSPILPAIVSIAKLDSDFLQKESSAPQANSVASAETSVQRPFSATWWLRITDSDSRLIASDLSMTLTENWCDSSSQVASPETPQDETSNRVKYGESSLKRELSFAQTDRETCMLLDTELEQYEDLTDPVKADLNTLLYPDEEVVASHQMNLLKEKMKEHEDELKNLCIFCPNMHKLVDMGNVPSGWNCDARHEAGGCLTMKNAGGSIFPGGQRFRCSQCDFDYCGPCNSARLQNQQEKIELKIKNLKSEISLLASKGSSSSKDSESKNELGQAESKQAESTTSANMDTSVASRLLRDGFTDSSGELPILD